MKMRVKMKKMNATVVKVVNGGENTVKKRNSKEKRKRMNKEGSKREAARKERMVWKKLSAVQRFVRTLLAPNAQISTTHVPVASVLSTV
jgi:hypothetical protein